MYIDIYVFINWMLNLHNSDCVKGINTFYCSYNTRKRGEYKIFDAVRELN